MMTPVHQAYRTFDVAGVTVAGVVTGEGTPNPNAISTGVLHNNAEAAYGLWWWGAMSGDQGLVDVARRVIRWTVLALPHAYQGALSYDPAQANWLQTPDSIASNLGALAWTGRWLVRWATDLDNEPFVYDAVSALGMQVVALQQPDGSFPPSTQISPQPPSGVTTLSSSSLAALFLAEAGHLTGDHRCTAAVARAGAFLARALPARPKQTAPAHYIAAGIAMFRGYRLTGQSEDLRLGIRCAEVLLGSEFDPGADPRISGTMPMLSAAELYAAAWRLTGQASYARAAASSVAIVRPRPDMQAAWSWRDVHAMSSYALIAANYPDSLEVGKRT